MHRGTLRGRAHHGNSGRSRVEVDREVVRSWRPRELYVRLPPRTVGAGRESELSGLFAGSLLGKIAALGRNRPKLATDPQQPTSWQASCAGDTGSRPNQSLLALLRLIKMGPLEIA